MLLAQLSDPHVTAPGTRLYQRVDTARHLAQAVEAVCALDSRPDAVLLTGDLVDRGQAAEYDHLRQLIAPLHAAGMRVFVLPGNHDHRATLQQAFADQTWMPPPPGFIQYVVDDLPVRVIMLDTWVEGKPYGRLCEARLAWLERVLAAGQGRPAVVCLHHPPFRTFIDGMDSMGLREPEPLAALIARHPEVERVLCGHLHRPIQARFAGTLAQTAPSTAHQLALSLSPGAKERYIMEPPGFLLHRWTAASGLVTHQVSIGEYAGPYAFGDADA